MLKVRTSVVNGTLDRDYAVEERWARRPFRRQPDSPPSGRSHAYQEASWLVPAKLGHRGESAKPKQGILI